MPQRHQTPFNWITPPGQMGPYQRPPYNPMWDRQMGPMRQTFPNRQMVPMRQPGQGGSRQGRQGGNILARLLKKAPKANSGFPGMYPSLARGGATKGSFLKSLTDPNAISSFLNNTQQVLQAAQQIGPMVSQYGPVIRNLPAMWKLYRGFKDAVNENPVEDVKSKEVSITDDKPALSKQTEKINSNETKKEEMQDHTQKDTDESSERNHDDKINNEFGIKGLSFPKLFI